MFVLARRVGESVQDESAAPGCGLYGVHNALSTVTESRRRCMPYDGTLDFPVIFVITAINIIAISLGGAKLAAEGEIISMRGTEEQNVKMIALVLGLVEAMPGFMFLWCDSRRFAVGARVRPGARWRSARVSAALAESQRKTALKSRATLERRRCHCDRDTAGNCVGRRVSCFGCYVC